MTTEVELLLREALALSDGDRADVAAELLASLDAPASDDPATVQALWREELERRAKPVLSAEATSKSWPSARQKLTDELTGPA